MNLLSPLLLIGAAFAAVPLIIHLLNRSRFRVERFSAMMFLEAAVQQRNQTLKLQQVLLMLLRMLLFALLAAALARPVSQYGNGATTTQPTTHVLVIDGSYSMQQKIAGKSAFETARELALQVVDGMDAHDNMQIIWAGGRPRPLFPAPTFDRPLLQRTIAALAPGVESCPMTEALSQAFWALEASTLPRHRIYVLSDRQGSGWPAVEDPAWNRLEQHLGVLKIRPALYVVAPTGPGLINVTPISAVSRMPIVDIFRPAPFVVELENFGADSRSVRVAYSVDGTVVRDERLTLPPGRTATGFDHRFTEAGDHFLSVQVKDDDLEVDNNLTQSLRVLDAVPVLIIDGTPSDDLFDSAAGLPAAALEAAGEPGGSSLFAVTVRPHLLMDQLDLATLQKYRCIILANVPSVSQFFAFQLEQYAERGGGVLIGLGDRVSPEAYAPLIKTGNGIFPARFVDIQQSGESFFHPAFPAGAGGMMLPNFDLTRTRVLDDVKVQHYWRCHANVTAVPLAFFGEDPFLLTQPYGRGRVALWSSSLGSQWTNFPVTPDYLPLLQDLVMYLSANTAPSANLVQGEQLVCVAGGAYTGRPGGQSKGLPPAELALPDGKTVELPFEAEGNDWVVKWSETVTPGVYTVKVPDQKPRFFTVNLPPDEGQLKLLDTTIVDTASKRLGAGFVETRAELNSLIAAESGVREWWQWLVFAAIAVLCLELYLGRVFSR